MYYHRTKVSKQKLQLDDEQQIEDMQSKLTMRYYHLDQAGPFAATGQPLSAGKLVLHQIQVLGVAFPEVFPGDGLSTGGAAGGISQYDSISGLMVLDFSIPLWSNDLFQ